MKFTLRLGPVPVAGCLIHRLILSSLLLGFSLCGWAQGTPGPWLQLHVAPPGISNEFSATPVLEWLGVAGASYTVQSSTNLADPDGWRSVDVAGRADGGPLKWMAPESLKGSRFYRVVTRPAITDVQPAWVNSDDSSAVLYLSGQLLPSNAMVVINGQNFSASTGPNGVLEVSLNGLPPGTPITGTILVLDGSSNVVATLPVQSPVVYGTTPTLEQLQGPPEEPPASLQALLAIWASKKGYDYYQAQSAIAGRAGYIGFRGQPISFAPGGGTQLTKKGYDYYQAQSAMNSAGAQSNPVFQEHQTAGEMPRGKMSPGVIAGIAVGSVIAATSSRPGTGIKTGHVTLIKREMAPGGDDDCDGVAENGVFAATGELRLRETDLAVPGRGLDFAWTRTYRSRTGPTTAQGAGWDFSFNVSLTAQPDGSAVLRTGDGRANTFYRDGTNGWVRDEYFTTLGDLDGDGIPDVAVFADTGKWLFQPQGTPGAGKLSAIVDRHGNSIALHYDKAGRLDTVTDDLGRTHSVGYDAEGRIASVTDFTGRMVRYEYNTAGDLVAVISPPVVGTPTGNDFPGGKTNRYAYSSGFTDDRLNHNLTACVDPKGQTWLEVNYQPSSNPASIDFDAVASLLRGIEKDQIKRIAVVPSPDNGFATTKAIACDAVGNVTEYFYDSRLRCVRQLEYTGRSNPALPVTEKENRPSGKLRADDPDYFETRWSWNRDSLCTRVVYPDGSSTEVVYESTYNQNTARTNKTRAHEGDARVIRERASSGGGDLDGDGAPDITELTWYFEYDPRFGSPASSAGRVKPRKGWDGLIYGNHRLADGDNTPIIRGSALGGLSRKGWDGTIKGNVGINEPTPDTYLHRKGWDGTVKGTAVADQDCDGFVTRITDPRGNVVTCEYDAAGRIIRRTHWANNITAEYDVALEDLFGYNPQGQLTSVTNAPDGTGARRVDKLTYHASGAQAGYVASIAIDEPGVHLTTAFEYDAAGNVTRVTDPRGKDWVYTYNALDQCVRSQSPTNVTVRCATVHFRYDANDNLTETISELRDETDSLVRNVSRLAEFDLLDRCVALARQVAPGVFLTNRFTYDGNGQLTAVLSPLAVSGVDPHNQVAFAYDERGLLFREIGAPGSGNSPTNQYDYTANGSCRKVSKVESLTIKQSLIGYDGFNRPVTFTDPMGNVIACVYDRKGNLTRVRTFGETNDVPGGAGNRLLAETRYSYDTLDRCVQQVDSFFDVFTLAPIGDGQSVTTFSYAPNGACTAVTDDNGRSTRYVYDTAGRCAQITDPKTNVVQFVYDAGGNLTGMISLERPDAGGAEQQFSRGYTYDALGRCVQTVDNMGNTTACAYDSLGRVVLETDASTNDTARVFDDLGRRLGTVHYAGKRSGGITINTSHVEYDTNGRVISSTDGNTNTTTYAYDSLDRCVLVTEADGTHRSLVWSPRSNLISVEDANGTTITNTYDLCDRIIHRDIAARGGAAGTTTFETFAYDGLSRCVAAANNSSVAGFAFDSLGNCVRSTQDGLTATSTYDGLGNCTSMTYPSGGTVTCVYDGLGQLTSIGRSAGGGLPAVTLASYAYDGPGRLSRITRANGVETRLQWNGKVNPANAAGDFGWRQVSGVSHQQAAGNRTVLDRRAFTYDRNQNKVERAQTLPFYPGGTSTTNLFAYDALNRLTEFTRETGGAGDFLRFYSLDANGNRLFAASNGVSAPYIMDATLPAPADFQMDQYTITPFGNQTYDENGNLTGRGSATGALQYVYDYADRLVAVNDLSSGLPTPVAAYAYDALSRRIGRTLFPAGGLPPVTTLFVYDGEDCDDADPIEEHENGSLKKTYVVPHVFETKGYRTFVMPHVFETKGRILIPAGGGVVHLHTDDLGNTLALTDQNGAVIERYDYDDHGLPSFLSADGLPLGTPASATGNVYLFGGMEWDAETGFYYGGENGHSDPQTGQKITPKISKESHGMFRPPGSYRQNPWSGGSAAVLKKEEGGRHTPFHNKYRPQYAAGRVSRQILKTFFEIGDKPTQAQFSALIDSTVSLADDRDLLGLRLYGKAHELKGHVTLIK